MAEFKLLNEGNVKDVDKEISLKWETEDTFNKTISNRENSDMFVFYDGPATANGMPGLHHMLSKSAKDAVCKYMTMQGKKVLRKIGWDTHGLPVELAIEKKLGLNSKKEIEEYGVDKFNKECRESVFENEELFNTLTKRMGQFIDTDNSYVTYKDSFIETEWWILKKIFEEKHMYEGHKILPYCPRCGTGLASHEVAQGYEEIDVDTVVVPMKLVNEDAYLLVWTTTPWTLLSNVAVAVNPEVEYVKAESMGYNFYVAKNLMGKLLGEEAKIISSFKGSELEGKEYEQLLPFITPNKKAFYVVLADYVTVEDGTGLVHIAPAFGEEDYQVGQKYDLPVLNPVDEEGKYTEGLWKGTFVIDADKEVIKYLKENDKLFKKERIKHNYPHCWRCHTPLIYYAKPSWYIKVTDIKDKLIEENKKINWVPNYVGEKRFGNWLENLNDWALSRNRYWGTPLPLWKCECGKVHAIGSKNELVDLAIEDINEDIDLHIPYVDDVHIKCPDCGKPMTRVKEVIDCWFDSGSMPFAQYHYPFENKELFETQFPADFIAEGVDQTRGWFYSLLVISTFIKGESPYKSVLVNDLICDKNGHKMHKSKGNSVQPFNALDEYGADVIRWYMFNVSPIWTPLKFDEDGLKEVRAKFFNTLKNVYNFFAMYANADNIDPREFEVEYKSRSEIDLWLLSKYQNLLKEVTEAYNSYDMTIVTRKVQNFVCEDLSNWYIRRNRRRFWASELTTDKKAVYATTYEVLLGVSKMIAPIASFLAEEMYVDLTGKESVHLEDFEKVKEELINNEIETKMDLVRDLISLGRKVREKALIKVRQPISKVLVDGKNEEYLKDLIPLIKEELNVKEVEFTNDTSKYMNYYVKPNFKLAGPIFGPNIKAFSKYLETIDLSNLENEKVLNIEINGQKYEINEEMLDIRIEAKEGFDVGEENNNFIILDTNLTSNLLVEGKAREFVSKIQQMRKTNDFEITDRIDIYYNGNLEEVLEVYSDFIKMETLADNIILDANLETNIELNDIMVGIKLIRK